MFHVPSTVSRSPNMLVLQFPCIGAFGAFIFVVLPFSKVTVVEASVMILFCLGTNTYTVEI